MNRWYQSMVAIAGLAVISGGAHAADKHEIDVSLETAPNHVRNISMKSWAKTLNEQSGGNLVVKIYDSASQYKGTNVPTALGQGALDMGAPGHWHLAKFVPEFNVLQLPMAYGASRKQIYAVMDGEVGDELNKLIEDKLNVKVLGRHFDLGYATMFFRDADVKDYKDIVGLKMRQPGGPANNERFRAFDANPVKIAWPDVPQALQRGTIDGLITTYESARSAKLWDAGLKHGFEDHQAFFQYVPMLSGRAWNSLPPEMQKMMADSWEAVIDDTRKLAAKRQDSAREETAKMGIDTINATAEQKTWARNLLMKKQPGIVEDLGIDKDFIARAKAAFDAAM